MPELATAEEAGQWNAREELGERSRLDARAAPKALSSRAARDREAELRAHWTFGDAGLWDVAAQKLEFRAQLLRRLVVRVQNYGCHRHSRVANKTHHRTGVSVNFE